MAATYTDWLPGVAWIYSRASLVDPTITIDTQSVTANGSGNCPYLFDFIPDLNSKFAIYLPNWSITVEDDKKCKLKISNPPGYGALTMTAPGMQLACIGYEVEPTEVLPAQEAHYSRAVPPLAIPLQSITWEKIDRESERELQIDRFRRGFGRTYGAIEVWRCRILLDAPALRALEVGYAQHGQVMISPFTLSEHIAGSATAYSKATGTGYVTGQFLGVEPGSWINAENTLYECGYVIAREAT